MDTKHLRTLLIKKANELMDNPESKYLDKNLQEIGLMISKIDSLENQMSNIYKHLNSDRFGLDILPSLEI
jgi:hypothetical protein